MGIEVVALAMMAAGTIMTAAQQREAADARARENQFAAEQSQADALAIKGQAAVEADRIRKAGERTVSRARSQLAASGVVTGAGTAQTIEDDITADADLDARMSLLSGSYQAQRTQANASRFQRQAGYDRAAGASAFTSGILGAGGSLLSGYGKLNAASKSPYPAPVEDRYPFGKSGYIRMGEP